MMILVLGGTRFVGRHLVEAAISAGHRVTTFNRGRTNPGLFPEIEKLHGDREGELLALEDGDWDAAIDVSGYLPRHVRRSASVLAKCTKGYVFISSAAVYSDKPVKGKMRLRR